MFYFSNWFVGCDFRTGECQCKRNVVGRDCNECKPFHYGLSADAEGCKACDCDPGGAFDNNCDIITGQCRCRPNVDGRRCDQPASAHFSPYIDYIKYEGELSRGSTDTQLSPRQPYPNSERSWTGVGFIRVYDRSSLEFDVTDIPSTGNYDVQIRYEPQTREARPQNCRVVLERLTGPPESNGVCSNAHDVAKVAVLGANDRQSVAQPGPFCLERGRPYRIRVEVDAPHDANRDTPSVLIDSVSDCLTISFLLIITSLTMRMSCFW